jgi:hypothetical protein
MFKIRKQGISSLCGDHGVDLSESLDDIDVTVATDNGMRKSCGETNKLGTTIA